MPEYDATAGFPRVHIEAFERVACRNKMVISSRELNPLCTDLVLEGYAAKGFHIKAKTCDWGPMAGFVPEDPRFTKGKQKLEDQQRDIEKAFEHGAKCAPLFISDERLQKLIDHQIVAVVSRDADQCEVAAAPDSGSSYRFTLVKHHKSIPQQAPPGCDTDMWGIYYQREQEGLPSWYRNQLLADFPKVPNLRPVNGMTNPKASTSLGVKAAVAGDYDLWCVFPHSSLGPSGVADRPMPLRATLVMGSGQGPRMQRLTQQFGIDASPLRPSGNVVTQAAKAAELIWRDKDQLVQTAREKEDPHLGNISLTINKIRAELNRECKAKGGDVVQHSDYGGNPFATIDYPLIFFVPDPKTNFALAAYEVAKDQPELTEILKSLLKSEYVLKLNPAWSLPLYLK